MANENQKHEQKHENEQSTTPAAQVELTEEELGQVVGGLIIIVDHIQPDPTMVE